LVGVLTACEAPKEIGLPPNASVGVIYTDTITVKVSTTLLDSVRTSGALQLLVGSYQHPTFGKITAQPFFTVFDRWTLDDTKTYEYDSVAITLGYSYFHGDTLQPFRVGVHLLTDSIMPKQTYYNISSVPFASNPLATKTFDIRPATNRQLNLRLADSFGQLLFEAAKNKQLTNPFDIIRRIKGFTLVPDAQNAVILGFAPTSILLRVFVHETGQTAALVRDFFPVNGVDSYVPPRFNQVLANRQGSVLSQLQPLQPLSTAQTRGNAYLQEALGVVMKIEFPYLSQILAPNDESKVAINRAELTIVPNQPNPRLGEVLSLPRAMTMAETDESNRLLRTRNDIELMFPDDSQTFSGFVFPQIVPYDPKFKNYNFTLTTYLQALTTGFKKNKAFLLMPMNENWLSSRTYPLSPFLNGNVNQMSLTPTKENVKLQLFYTVIK